MNPEHRTLNPNLNTNVEARTRKVERRPVG